MGPAELERSILRALSDLSRTRPRIVEFAPDVALKRALERVYAAHRARGGAQVPALAGCAQQLPATG
jgi:hypothetical protein